MLPRPWRRPLGALALAACSPLVHGCASTHRFVVAPGAVAELKIEAVALGGERVLPFDGAGGVLDPEAGEVRGRRSDGKAIEVPLAKVHRLWLRARDGEKQATIRAHPAALTKGAGWRPDGALQLVSLRSGRVIELKQVPASIDAKARVLRYAPAGEAPQEVPFADILYVQIRDTHPGRTLLCVVGCAFLAVGIGVGIALSSDSMGLGAN